MMKFTLFASALLFCSLSLAQTNVGPATHADIPTPTPAPEEYPVLPRSTRPFTLNIGLTSHHFRSSDIFPLVHAVLSRFTAIGLDGLVAKQKENAISEKTYWMGFTASGAAVFNYELMRSDEAKDLSNYEDIGKNAGIQLFPFTISISPSGPYYVSFGAIAFRNMNALQNTRAEWDNPRRVAVTPDGFWRVMDNLDILVLKFDQGYAYSQMSSKHVEYASFDAKMDILGSHVDTRYLAIKIGGGITTDSETFFSPNGTRTDFGAVQYGSNGTELAWSPFATSPLYEDGNLNLNFRYGFEFNNENHKGFRVNFKALIKDQWMHGDAVTTPPAPSGGPAPAPEQMNYSHNSTYVDPDLELSKRISNGRSGPVYLGGGIAGHIPVSDVIQTTGSFGRIDLSPYNNQLAKVKLFIRF